MSEPRHWVKYVRWDVIARWRKRVSSADRADAPVAERALPYPYAFASNDAAFRRIAGGVIWLISSPTYGRYRLPPSLIARLHVNQVVAAHDPVVRKVDPDVLRAGRWIALADSDQSVYLPLNNAFDVLYQLRFQGRSPELMRPAARSVDSGPPSGLYSRIPGYFQRHRVVDGDSVAVLENYAQAVLHGRRFFVSYRWRDFEDNALWLQQLTDALVETTASCWWDRRHVPQQDLSQFQLLLSDILDDAIRQSVIFVALMKDRYFQGNTDPDTPTWVRQEWDRAGQEIARQSRRQQLTRVAAVFADQPSAADWIAPSDVVIRFGADEPAIIVAQRLASLLPPT